MPKRIAPYVRVTRYAGWYYHLPHETVCRGMRGKYDTATVYHILDSGIVCRIAYLTKPAEMSDWVAGRRLDDLMLTTHRTLHPEG